MLKNMMKRYIAVFKRDKVFDLNDSVSANLYPWNAATTECLCQLKNADFTFTLRKNKTGYTYRAIVNDVVYTNEYKPVDTLSQAVIGLYLDIFGFKKLREVQNEFTD